MPIRKIGGLLLRHFPESSVFSDNLKTNK